MATFTISRVTALPGTLDANTVYLVSTGANHLELYATGNTADARRILTETDIQALIDASISGLSAVEIVADIAARDALTLTANAMVLVLDASADSTVTSGAALYAYRQSNDTFTKVAEYESMDVTINWSDIVGRPSSTPAQIDTAVANSHTHANKTQLDQIGQSASGDITYNSREYVRSGTAGW